MTAEQVHGSVTPCRLRWNLAYANAYAEMLGEKNNVL